MKQQKLFDSHVPADSSMKLAMRIARNMHRFKNKVLAEEAWYNAVRSSSWYRTVKGR